jgi:hypothetical protein
MWTIVRLALFLLLSGYVVSSPAMAANTLMTGVVGEIALACDAAKLEVIVRLLRKADPKSHKLIEQSLKKGDCVEINNGTSVVILGRDNHAGSSRSNYLIWHSNGKVYSLSENKVLNLSIVSDSSSLIHPSATRPSPVAILPEPAPSPAIKPISASAERTPESIDEPSAVSHAWWLVFGLCFLVGPVPLFSVLATHAASQGWWLFSHLDSFHATAIAIIAIAGLAGLHITKRGKPSVLTVIPAYRQAARYLILTKRAVTPRAKGDRKALDARREPVITLREFQETTRVVHWPRRLRS